MTQEEWRFRHGVGPEPHYGPPAEFPRYHPPALPAEPARDRIWVIPDEDLVVVTGTTKNGLDTWDF